ncbi:hypothetical protein [Rhizobium rhizogenes]|jgi:hypothetical protein|uniref:hypothetical protein n=1 Tax=Rhizobium rhizogenes TaxID=359 RepID=UPI001F47DEB2|nr:hypothetical protein [Rhizobium rhizogenes]
MLMVIVGGIVLLGVFLLFGQLWGGAAPALATAAKAFIPVWLVVSVANLWVGVNKAGYTVAQEPPTTRRYRDIARRSSSAANPHADA